MTAVQWDNEPPQTWLPLVLSSVKKESPRNQCFSPAPSEMSKQIKEKKRKNRARLLSVLRGWSEGCGLGAVLRSTCLRSISFFLLLGGLFHTGRAGFAFNLLLVHCWNPMAHARTVRRGLSISHPNQLQNVHFCTCSGSVAFKSVPEYSESSGKSQIIQKCSCLSLIHACMGVIYRHSRGAI